MPEVRKGGDEVALLFANSNIDTQEEFDKRLNAARTLAEAEGVPISALPYDHGEWLREVAVGYEHEPEKGERCARCFRYNLAKTAEYANAHGFDSFTTSLTVSPHKVSSMIFAAAEKAVAAEAGQSIRRPAGSARFAPYDFKAHDGYGRSVERATALGLYRQSYCGCEFSKARWNIHHKHETASTNIDARAGGPRDVFTADFQTAGRGRLDHKWSSKPGENLLMSVVLPVDGQPPEAVATLPLVAGLAVANGLVELRMREDSSIGDDLRGRITVKWPNDVLVDGKKIAGILCERQGECVIVGIGVNVRQCDWPADVACRATSLLLATGRRVKPVQVRNAILDQLGKWHGIWRDNGFEAVHREISALDVLNGRIVSVRQRDCDAEPVRGLCGGIRPDGSLDVGGTHVYAGEAHVEEV